MQTLAPARSSRLIALVAAAPLVMAPLVLTTPVMASGGSALIAADSFGRTAKASWGSAEVGGAWSTCVGTCASLYSVGGTGAISVAAGKGPGAYLSGVRAANSDVSVSVGLDRMPTGSGAYLSITPRGGATEGYRGKLRVTSAGRVELSLVRVTAAKELVLAATTPAITYSVGERLRIRAQAVGSSPTKLNLKVWRHGQAEPAGWQLSSTDTTAALQDADSVGVLPYLSGSATNGPVVVTFDDLMVSDPTVPNVRPVAGFTAVASDLSVAVDGSQSVDSDGSIVSYAWTFGDGSSASGVKPAAHVYAKAGTYTVTLSVTDDRGGVSTSSKTVTVNNPVVASAPTSSSVGARLPVSYQLSSLPGTVRYVSASGSDAGTGSLTSPFRTLVKAESVSAAGDSIVVRGGVYPVKGNAVVIDRPGLTVVAYPGEVPVFDGSIAAPTAVTSEGTLVSFPYQPMPAGIGEGLGLANLPAATFSGGSPTGLAAARGWRCVTGSSTYSVPVPTTSDPDGCPGTASVVTGFWPDQVWVDGRPLVQVSDKARVRAGTFWVDRNSATDGAPGASRLFMAAADASDMSKVRISSSNGNFIHVAADGVRLTGFRVQRHSPAWSKYALVATSGVDDLVVRDVAFDQVAAISFKVAGGSSSSSVNRRATLERVSVTDAGWMGAVVLYADDLSVTASLFDRVNVAQEFARGPQSGAIKTTKTHRMKMIGSVVSNVGGHALWWDQSNYDVTVARNRLVNNSHSAVFFEISHGLTMVDNFIQAASTDPGAEGHSAVRIAGSSGVRLVNNTILGAPVGVGVYADPRSRKYDSNGDGVPDRYCSEHTVRYGQGGSAGTDCNVPYTSDFDLARPGAYSPTGATNLTPKLTWIPGIEMLVNNVVANQSGPLSSGWTPCGGRTPVCAYTYVSSPATEVAAQAVFAPGALVNGNVYQTSGSRIAAVLTRSGSTASGAFSASSLAGLKTAFSAAPYALAVEANGQAGTGWVTSSGTPTSQLTSSHAQAAPVPTDTIINTYLAPGLRAYGTTQQ